ncbi:MAG: hybrid sensor histidine kinase/response regulator [Candidatus Acidiferrales bacterium]
MQSRFILMEGLAVLLALLLMSSVMGITILVRFQVASGLTNLHQRIILHSELHTAFDRTILGFWRCYGTCNPTLLVEYQSSAAELRSATKQMQDASAPVESQQEARTIAPPETDLLQIADRLAAIGHNSKADDAAAKQIPIDEAQIRKTFRQVEQRQFENLTKATKHLDRYNDLVRVLVLILGSFPVLVMLYFHHLRRRHIWAPLEQLHRMVMEVESGNLDVKGEVPATIELGSVTGAFLTMASQLREMRDSLEEKVRHRAAQLEAAHKDLVRAAKLASLGQLVSGVAHEINNPLTSILGFSEVVLSRPSLDAATHEQVRTIRAEALRLKRLVASLSQFSRRAPKQLHRMDLRAIPDRLIELRSYQLAANNVRIRYSRPEEPIWINGDADSLLQMMLQFALNAEHAIREFREQGEILLECEILSGKARITVEDNGCGMLAEIRDHIFDPFFSGRPQGQGTGLGLSICHGIVEQHSGEITVESEPGKGTKVRVLLPLLPSGEVAVPTAANNALEEIQVAETSKNRRPIGTDAARRFLVIDDESEILNLLSVVLGKTGATVVTLQDSTRLNTLLSHEHFDAVLCDLKMPGQDGLSVLRTLREKKPELARRFLLMTGNLADADKARIELEGVPILPKPFTLARLREMMGKMVLEGN